MSYYSILHCSKVLNGIDEDVIPQLVNLKFHHFLVTMYDLFCSLQVLLCSSEW